MGSGILFTTALAVLLAVTLATPPESRAVLTRFYERCRPPAWWKAIRAEAALPPSADPPLRRMVFDSLLGMLACLGLVTATNAVFTGDIPACALGIIGGGRRRRLAAGPLRSFHPIEVQFSLRFSQIAGQQAGTARRRSPCQPR